MTLLLQISDPHFGTEQAPVVDALLRLIDARVPELVVMSGDITQRARRGQFRAALGFVDRLGATPVIAVPGNHDIPLFNLYARLVHPYANYRRAFGDDLEPVFESSGLLVIGVNATRPYRRKDGEVSAEQIERVAKRLEDAGPRQLRVVITHQPVAAARAGDQRNLLHGRVGAMRRWVAAGVDLVVGGHLHRPYVVRLDPSFDGLKRRAWAVQAGTALSSRVRGGVPNSVNLIRYDDGGHTGHRRATVERWDFQHERGAFERVTQHELDFDAHAVEAPLASPA
jgi:3',5'-cyclic AMP phosphodiesterase CpdA